MVILSEKTHSLPHQIYSPGREQDALVGKSVLICSCPTFIFNPLQSNQCQISSFSISDELFQSKKSSKIKKQAPVFIFRFLEWSARKTSRAHYSKEKLNEAIDEITAGRLNAHNARKRYEISLNTILDYVKRRRDAKSQSFVRSLANSTENEKRLC